MARIPAIPEPSRELEIARLELTKLAKDSPLEQVFARACEISAQALRVDRVGVWLFIDDRSALRCANVFERSTGEHSSGAVLCVADFPTYFASLKIRKALPAEVAATEPWAAELASAYLRPLGITSMLDAGIFMEGNLIGVVCHEHIGPPREWTTEARDFAGSVADWLALRIQSAEVRELRAAFLTQQERLADQDKSAALAQLAAGVAHDFRNLLAVFLGKGEQICLRRDVPQEVRDHARTIIAAAERGIAIARELTDFARPTEQAPTVLDLATTTAAFLPMLRSLLGSHHAIRFTQPTSLGHVLLSKTQYTRLLMNLVVNAKEAMPGGGGIEIRLTPVRLKDDPSYSGPFVMLEVADEGTGIDEAARRSVFEPFYTTKAKGTGLGLAIVRQVVDRAGGFIRIEGAPGKGTTFRIFLPRIGASTGGTMEFAVPPELMSS